MLLIAATPLKLGKNVRCSCERERCGIDSDDKGAVRQEAPAYTPIQREQAGCRQWHMHGAAATALSTARVLYTYFSAFMPPL